PPSSILVFVQIASAPTKFYTLTLHAALPIFTHVGKRLFLAEWPSGTETWDVLEDAWVRLPDPLPTVPATNDVWCVRQICDQVTVDRKSTRLNSSHVKISYAVLCWKRKQATNT